VLEVLHVGLNASFQDSHPRQCFIIETLKVACNDGKDSTPQLFIFLFLKGRTNQGHAAMDETWVLAHFSVV
jgi:hypothetical protein